MSDSSRRLGSAGFVFLKLSSASPGLGACCHVDLGASFDPVV